MPGCSFPAWVVAVVAHGGNAHLPELKDIGVSFRQCDKCRKSVCTGARYSAKHEGSLLLSSNAFIPGLNPGAATLDGWTRVFASPANDEEFYSIPKESIDYCPDCAPLALDMLLHFNSKEK